MNATATTARRVFRVLGTTDDVTVCELCGRAELRGTVVLAVLDADGNDTGERVHYGSSCGARAAGWTTAEVNRMAKDADAAARALRVAEHTAVWDAYHARQTAARELWCAGRPELAGASVVAQMIAFQGSAEHAAVAATAPASRL